MNKLKTKRKSKIKKFFLILLFILIVTSISFVGYYFYLSNTVSLNTDLLSSINTPIEIFDNNNNLIKTDSILGTPLTKINDLNQYTIDAFTSIEDNTFYSHNGINPKRIIKAFINNILSGHIVEGASTISQQLIKNTHLESTQTIERKIKEISLAIELENKYTKDEIMELYLNAIYFGSGCYGIESASNFFFDKKASDLTINESAILAGIIKSPTYYSPINYKDNCLRRKNLVLLQMLKYNKISKNEYEKAKNTNLNICLNNNSTIVDSSYIQCVTNEAIELLNLNKTLLANKGYKIYTYYDENKQKNLINNITNETALIQHNGIIIDNKTGGINAFVSSIKYGGEKVKRSPASTLKPILVYAPALENGTITNSTIILDEPTTFTNNYSPKNINDKYYGKISCEEALSLSLNIPAVKILDKNGIENSKSFASNCGIEFDKDDTGLSLALGAMKYGINIQTLCDAYSPIANNGYYKKSTFIKKIVDNNGKIIYSHNIFNKKVTDEATSYLVGDMMRTCANTGTCKALNSLNFDCLAKSGTNGTNDPNLNTDMLCIALTTQDTACVWYFSNDNKTENLINTSYNLSPTICIKNIFTNIYNNNQPQDFEQPKSVVEVTLDKLTYEDTNELLIANQSIPDRFILNAKFNLKYAPNKTSELYQKIIIPTLEYKVTNEGVNLKFDTLKHQKYELIKFDISSNNETSLISINNKKESIEYIDTFNRNAVIYYLKVGLIGTDSHQLSNSILIEPKNINQNPKPQIQNNSYTKPKWYF